MSRNSSLKSFFFILQLLTSIICLHCSVALKTVLMSSLCDKNSSPYIHLDSLESGILKTDFDSEADVDCKVVFVPQARASVVFSFYSYNLLPGDHLTITDYENHKIGLQDAGSFQDERKSFISNGIMSLHYIRNRTSRHHALGEGFQLTFTHTKNEPTCISTKEFKCHNQQCIDKRLACDGHNHCGDNSDQKDCQPNSTSHEVSSRSTSALFVALISIGASALLIVIIVFTVCAVRIRKKKQAAKQTAQTNPEPAKTSDVELPTISTGDISGSHTSGYKAGDAPALYPHFSKEWSQPPTAPGFENGHSNAGFSET